MKVLYFSLYLVSASATRTVDEIYQPEQKVVYGTGLTVSGDREQFNFQIGR